MHRLSFQSKMSRQNGESLYSYNSAMGSDNTPFQIQVRQGCARLA